MELGSRARGVLLKRTYRVDGGMKGGIAGRRPDRPLREPRSDNSPPTEVSAGSQCVNTTTLGYRAAPPYPPNHSRVSIGGVFYAAVSAGPLGPTLALRCGM